MAQFDGEAFAEAVREWKGSRSLREAAAEAGVQHPTLLRIMRQSYQPQMNTFKKLLTAMNRRAEDFIRED